MTRRLCYSKWILVITLVGMAYGFVVSAQSQDSINATLIARQAALDERMRDTEDRNDKRFDRIETMMQWGLFGIFGNVAGTLMAILRMPGFRIGVSKEPEGV